MLNYFKDDKILITGASGLLGRHLFNYLKEQGCNVVGVCNSKKQSDLLSYDLTSFEANKELLAKEEPQYVFMLANKNFGAGVMSTTPEVLIRDNLAMNSNMLELCYHNNVKKVMFVSSSTVYQECDHPIMESELDLNQDPFGLYFGVAWVKRYTEKLCEFYSRRGLNINIIRPVGIYGEYDKLGVGSHFLPAIAQRILDNPPYLEVWGDGKTFRNLIYAPDLVRDMLLVMVNYNNDYPMNIASDTNVYVEDVVNLLVKITGYKGDVLYNHSKPDALKYRTLDNSMFNEIIGKQEYTSLEEGLTNTVEWIKSVR